MRLPCRLTMIMLSPGVWNRPTISGSSRSTHSYWMGDMNAAFMWMSGAPSRLDTSTSTPSTGWLVRMSTPRSRAAISMRRVNSTPSPGSPSGSCGMTTRPKGTLSISFPCRKAEGRGPRPVQGRPCEARDVGHGVLARVRDALLLHEVVVGDPRPGGGLAPGPAPLLGGLEQDGRRAELRGVHRRAEPRHGGADHDDVRLAVPPHVAVDRPADVAHRCSPLADDRRRR